METRDLCTRTLHNVFTGILLLLRYYGGGQKNPFLEPFATYNGAKIEYTISIETLRKNYRQ